MGEGIRYVRNGGVAIAYQVVGDGEIDLVYVPDYVSNLVYGWESPALASVLRALARSFRLILFDKRGTGLSDHGAHFAALETRMEDLRAVLDAVGSSSAVVLGAHEGCGMAALFAATYPERTRALVLFHPVARGSRIEDPRDAARTQRAEGTVGDQAWCDEMLRDGCPTLYRGRGAIGVVRQLATRRRQPGGRLRAQPSVCGDRSHATSCRRSGCRRSSSIGGGRIRFGR